MMNGKIRIGQKASNFGAITTYENRKLSDYKGKWIVFFRIPETLPHVLQMLETTSKKYYKLGFVDGFYIKKEIIEKEKMKL